MLSAPDGRAGEAGEAGKDRKRNDGRAGRAILGQVELVGAHMDDFFSRGLPVGRIAGIQLRIHWTLLIFWAWRLNAFVLQAEPRYRGILLGIWGITTGLLFGSILLHELGHAFAARREGGRADDILLWPLGGLAFCSVPDLWRSHLIVAAAGPAVTAVIAIVSWGVFSLADQFISFEPFQSEAAIWGSIFYGQARDVLVNWSLLILVFNLIPLYPLDGGRILHSALWGFLQRRGGYGSEGFGYGGYAGYGFGSSGYSRASQITLAVSRAVAIGGIAFGAWQQEPFYVIIFVWALLGAESLKNR